MFYIAVLAQLAPVEKIYVLIRYTVLVLIQSLFVGAFALASSFPIFMVILNL
jgi:hypothetical protein